jgi:hypothetical protein
MWANGWRSEGVPLPKFMVEPNAINGRQRRISCTAPHSGQPKMTTKAGLNGNTPDPSRRTAPRSRARLHQLIRARPFFKVLLLPTSWTSQLFAVWPCDSHCRSDSHCQCVLQSSRYCSPRRLQMQHQPPRLSPPGGSCVAPRLAVVVVAAVAALVAVAVQVVVFARTLAAPSQS